MKTGVFNLVMVSTLVVSTVELEFALALLSPLYCYFIFLAFIMSNRDFMERRSYFSKKKIADSKRFVELQRKSNFQKLCYIYPESIVRDIVSTRILDGQSVYGDQCIFLSIRLHMRHSVAEINENQVVIASIFRDIGTILRGFGFDKYKIHELEIFTIAGLFKEFILNQTVLQPIENSLCSLFSDRYSEIQFSLSISSGVAFGRILKFPQRPFEIYGQGACEIRCLGQLSGPNVLCYQKNSLISADSSSIRIETDAQFMEILCPKGHKHRIFTRRLDQSTKHDYLLTYRDNYPFSLGSLTEQVNYQENEIFDQTLVKKTLLGGFPRFKFKNKALEVHYSSLSSARPLFKQLRVFSWIFIMTTLICEVSNRITFHALVKDDITRTVFDSLSFSLSFPILISIGLGISLSPDSCPEAYSSHVKLWHFVLSLSVVQAIESSFKFCRLLLQADLDADNHQKQLIQEYQPYLFSQLLLVCQFRVDPERLYKGFIIMNAVILFLLSTLPLLRGHSIIGTAQAVAASLLITFFGYEYIFRSQSNISKQDYILHRLLLTKLGLSLEEKEFEEDVLRMIHPGKTFERIDDTQLQSTNSIQTRRSPIAKVILSGFRCKRDAESLSKEADVVAAFLTTVDFICRKNFTPLLRVFGGSCYISSSRFESLAKDTEMLLLSLREITLLTSGYLETAMKGKATVQMGCDIDDYGEGLFVCGEEGEYFHYDLFGPAVRKVDAIAPHNEHNKIRVSQSVATVISKLGGYDLRCAPCIKTEENLIESTYFVEEEKNIWRIFLKSAEWMPIDSAEESFSTRRLNTKCLSLRGDGFVVPEIDE
eukprot:TRINITY_DN4704_c0_g1_i11.p1 TRINITY_DN4704_c0_g1~~TRINITY_DN4704_c0_g1_i11.p1  ORF type:complete len:823 (-),score=98.32 TRINITY_DN4704_c0_g1_i11:97-2565(-)